MLDMTYRVRYGHSDGQDVSFLSLTATSDIFVLSEQDVLLKQSKIVPVVYGTECKFKN